MFEKLKKRFIIWLVGKFTEYQDLKCGDQGWSWIILKRKRSEGRVDLLVVQMSETAVATEYQFDYIPFENSEMFIKLITNHSQTKAVHELSPMAAAKLQDTLAKWREGHPYTIEDDDKLPVADSSMMPRIVLSPEGNVRVAFPLDKKPLE